MLSCCVSKVPATAFRTLRLLTLFPALAAASLLSSCGGVAVRPSATAAFGNTVAGGLHGGQQPVAGASVQLWAVGMTGNASAATPLLAQPAITDAGGNFSIPATYMCPSSSALVYLTGTGGNPGLAGTVNNGALALMAALSRCGDPNGPAFVDIDEVTTVAAVTAFAPYMTAIDHVGSADPIKMAAAFHLANSLANPSAGAAGGPALAGGLAAPTTQINTLADLLAACVNTPGGIAGDGSVCGTLFTNAGGPSTTDTVAAMLQIANNPTRNVGALFGLVSPVSPFQPMLSAPPSSFAVALTNAPLTADPVITPNPGNVLPGQIFTFTITDSTPGAVIYYLTNGDVPTLTDSMIYTGPLTPPPSGNLTVAAFAVAPGSLPSNTVGGGQSNYSYVPTPVFTPAPGFIPAGQAVTITDPAPGAVIHYTLDGSTATAASPVYTGPITIAGAVTIALYVTAPSFQDSQAGANYFTTPPPQQEPYIYSVAGGGALQPCGLNPPQLCPGYFGEGGPATAAVLGPFGVGDLVFDSSANLYVATSYRLDRIDAATGVITRVFYGMSSETPNALAIDRQNNLYFFESLQSYRDLLVKLNPAIHVVTSLSTFDIGSNLNDLRLAVDSAGNVFVSQSAAIAGTYGDVVQRVDAVSGAVTTVVGTGTVGFSGDGGPATAAQLNGPGAVAFDSSDNLYIADVGNGRIRRVDHATSVITTIAGGGPGPFQLDGVSATSTVLRHPDALAFDSAGDLYVSDVVSSTLLITNPLPIRKIGTGGVITTVAGQNPNQNALFDLDTTNGKPASTAILQYVPGLAVGPDGNLYLSDEANNRIRELVLH